MPDATMDTVVLVAIGVLAAIFVASVVGLLIACKHKWCKSIDLISRQHQHNDPNHGLVENMEVESTPRGADALELDNVAITNWEQIMGDQTWVQDATGLAPHCLAILKTTHLLTEKLVGMTMGNSQQLRNPEALSDLVVIAKRIGPRVDDVVKAMYPPLDPRLLEARCSALVLSVSHLVMVTKNACRLSGVLDWIDQSLADVEDHLRVLHEASVAYESSLRSTASHHSQKETSLVPSGGDSAPSSPPRVHAQPGQSGQGPSPGQSQAQCPSPVQPLPECIPNQDSSPSQRNESSEV